MTDELAFMLATAIAAVCGAAAGRVFAVEAENRRTAVLAAAYCGAGAGLLGGPIFAFLLVLVARLLDTATGGATAALVDAAEATGPALLWGPAGGAAGGLLVGIVVAALKRYAPR